MTKHVKAEWYGSYYNLPNGSYIDKDGNVCYVENGKKHREDGPAIECANGYKAWYINGKRHREDGPAIEYYNGDKRWYRNGELHREDGPAVELDGGTKEWWINGKRHREDGPAIEHGKVWFVDNNEYITEEAYLEALKVWKMNEVMK